MHKLTNIIYGRWTVKSFSHRKGSHYFYNCLCLCGVFKKVDISGLRSGRSKSCGCLAKEISREQGKKSFKDISGKIFGKLLVLKRSENNIPKLVRYICKCDCGNIREVSSSNLKYGHTKSCGCLAKTIHIKHHMYNHPIYKVYFSMKSRCHNKKNKRYKNYGGRGIVMCDEWKDSFEQFYKDMGPKPSPKHSIDRINNNGNYCKENCKWSTREQQDSNKTNNIFISHNGITKTITQWSKILNVSVQTLMKRHNNKWDDSKIIEAPVKNYLLTFNGMSKTLPEWSKFMGSKDEGAVRTRLKRGWTIERALTQPFKFY